MSVRGRLQHPETFPYDALDVIFAFAVSDINQVHDERRKEEEEEEKPTQQKKSFTIISGKRTAASFALVCKFWRDRFLEANEMWSILIKQDVTNGRRAGGASWDSYGKAKQAHRMTKERLKWLVASELAPIEDCGAPLRYNCPVYAEALTYIGNKEFHCDGCGKSVFLVTTSGEKEERAAQGHCVILPTGGRKKKGPSSCGRLERDGRESDESARVNGRKLTGGTRTNVAIVVKTQQQLETLGRETMLKIANYNPGETIRTYSTFPTLTLQQRPPDAVWESSLHFVVMTEKEASEQQPGDDALNKFSNVILLRDSLDAERDKALSGVTIPPETFGSVDFGAVQLWSLCVSGRTDQRFPQEVSETDSTIQEDRTPWAVRKRFIYSNVDDLVEDIWSSSAQAGGDFEAALGFI